MSKAMSKIQALSSVASSTSDALLNALPHPIIMVAKDGRIADANVAAEQFFEASTPMLRRHMLRDLVPVAAQLSASHMRWWIAVVNSMRKLSTAQSRDEVEHNVYRLLENIREFDRLSY